MLQLAEELRAEFVKTKAVASAQVPRQQQKHPQQPTQKTQVVPGLDNLK